MAFVQSYNTSNGALEIWLNGSSVEYVTTPTPRCLYQVRELDSGFDQFIFIMFIPVLATIAITGIIGNCLSYAVLTREMRRDGSSFCLKSLAMVDNTVLITYSLYYIPPGIFVYSGYMEWYYEIHNLIKPYIWTLVWTTKAVSIYIVIFVTCSRYIAVSIPLKAHVYCTTKAAKVGLCTIIICSILYNLPKIWQFETRYVWDNCTSRFRPDSRFNSLYSNVYFRVIYVKVLYMIVMFAFPLTILSILNFQLVKHVRRANRIRLQMSAQQRHKVSDSTTQRIIGVVFAFILLETPAIVVNVLYIFRDYWQGEPLKVNWDMVKYVMQVTYILSIINSSINFYIYVLIGKRFRMILQRMCTCSKKHNGATGMESQYMSVHRNSESLTPLRVMNSNNRRRETDNL